jgi:hypothetical protein
MEPRFRVLEPSPAADPEGKRLRAVLHAHLELERMRAVRLLLVQLLALLGFPLWLTAAWPRLVPASLQALLLAAWAMVGGATTWAFVAVVRCKRRYARLDAEMGG